MKSYGVTIQMKPLQQYFHLVLIAAVIQVIVFHHFTKSVKIGNFGVFNWAIPGEKSKFERCYTDNNRNQHQS